MSYSAIPRLPSVSQTIKWLLVTVAVVGAVVVAYPKLAALLLAGSHGVFDYQYWRILTFALVPRSLLSLGVSLLFIYLIGSQAAQTFGERRAIYVFVIAGMGAAAFVTLFGPVVSAAGTISAVFGLIAAQTALKARYRQDIRGDLVLLVILLLFSLVAGSGDWLAELGGMVFGGLAGAVIAFAPYRNNERVTRLRLALLAVAALVLATVGYVI